MYVIESRNYTTNNSTSYDRFQTALAWFGKFPSVVDGGTVKVNDNELSNIFNYYTASAFLEFQDTLFRGNNANALWNVQGNAAAGVPAFSHSDDTPLPVGPYFTLPASVNINNSLTVNHNPTSGAVGVIYTLRGANGDTTKYVANTSSSISLNGQFFLFSIPHSLIKLSCCFIVIYRLRLKTKYVIPFININTSKRKKKPFTALYIGTECRQLYSIHCPVLK